MPEAIQLDASDVVLLEGSLAGGLHEELYSSDDERCLRIMRRRLEGFIALQPVEESRRVLLTLEGQGARVQHGKDGPRAFLRPLEPYRSEGTWQTQVEGHVTLLEVLLGDDQQGPQITALHLGKRVLREALSTGATFLYAHRGGLVARITDEEDPFQLAAGESLWLDGLEADMELEIKGLDAALVIFRLQLKEHSTLH